MAGKKRSGLVNDRRGYGRSSYYYPIKKPIAVVPTTYAVNYNGNLTVAGSPIIAAIAA